MALKDDLSCLRKSSLLFVAPSLHGYVLSQRISGAEERKAATP